MTTKNQEITSDQKFIASIEDYVENVKRIWPLNAERSPLLIWMEVVGKAASVCEGVRKLEWEVVENELATLIMWWFAFIGRMNDISEESGDYVIFKLPNKAGDILWRHYPYYCPACVSSFMESNPEASLELLTQRLSTRCTCLISKKSKENRSEKTKALAEKKTKELANLFIAKKPKTLNDFDVMFREIYDPNIYALSPDEIAFHLLEEVGEVSEALANATIHKEIEKSDFRSTEFLNEVNKKSEHIEKELADVFSWTISLAEKSKLILLSATRLCITYNTGRIDEKILTKMLDDLSLPTQNLTLIDMIWKKYEVNEKLGHNTCHQNVCDCDKKSQLLLWREPMIPVEIRKKIASTEM